jgi:hypothetical protein
MHTLQRFFNSINTMLAVVAFSAAGRCVSAGFEQRGFVGLWQPHLRGQNIAANVLRIADVANLKNKC